MPKVKLDKNLLAEFLLDYQAINDKWTNEKIAEILGWSRQVLAYHIKKRQQAKKSV